MILKSLKCFIYRHRCFKLLMAWNFFKSKKWDK
ncbi:hypothetical protein CKO_00557 [Citrobacter koseri ATCC BAA-895]|uniref:Uncharacterized protein n=1 Tax=Citrobacter koseri (strain ATCC BAA-895 / CDC 4225-83 / SGSC4696) TaxID=290338 RepID=A8ADZ9_CITK8|nr:hypothetical protein CKO_00557 [Citrobacter koseri ATCC BAA-895]